MEHARHVLRVAFLLVAVVSVGLLVRVFLIPPSYGEYGPYRADDVATQRAKPVMHHGAKSCKGCHEKQWTLREDGEMHLKVSCEVCHGPLAKHATGTVKGKDKKLADMPIDKTFKLCARCHRKLEARPAGFPQVVFDEKHTKGEKIEGAVCKNCHDPHSTMYEEPAEGEGAKAGEEAKDEEAKDEVSKPAEEPKTTEEAKPAAAPKKDEPKGATK